MSPAGPPPTMHALTPALGGASMASRYQLRSALGRGRGQPLRCLRDGGQSGHRVAVVAPGPESAGEGPHPLDAATSQDQRHTGARGFVGSGAVEDDLALARDLLVMLVE